MDPNWPLEVRNLCAKISQDLTTVSGKENKSPLERRIEDIQEFTKWAQLMAKRKPIPKNRPLGSVSLSTGNKG